MTGLVLTCNASSHTSKPVKVTKPAIPSFNNKMILPCQQPLKQGQEKVVNDDEACDHLLYQQPLKQSKYSVVTQIPTAHQQPLRRAEQKAEITTKAWFNRVMLFQPKVLFLLLLL